MLLRACAYSLWTVFIKDAFHTPFDRRETLLYACNSKNSFKKTLKAQSTYFTSGDELISMHRQYSPIKSSIGSISGNVTDVSFHGIPLAQSPCGSRSHTCHPFPIHFRE